MIKEEDVVEHLLEWLSEQAEEAEPVAMCAEGDRVFTFQGTEAQGEKLVKNRPLSLSFRANVAPVLSNACDAASVHEQVVAPWDGPVDVVLLAFVLYTSGLRYATVGGWLGVDASTICRWLEPCASLGWMWVQQHQGAFSGQVAVDEKPITIDGATWYLCVAVDGVTRFPLHIAFYPSNTGTYCLMFL